MITDVLTTFCDNTALNTGVAGSYIIGDVLDLGATARGLGTDTELYLVITVDTTATSGGLATGQFSLVTDDNSSLSSPTVLVSSAAIPVATLVQGYKVIGIELAGGNTVERYIGIQQTTGTAAFTAGKINAFLTNVNPGRYAYPDALASGA